ncbi:hypothetical protein C2E21_3316 [Chlorella sorokiniana]|uniref:Uncharacterized protein n=1 Tax=Chlorella sorokiniana TaxID=3076 RepID=A0A2P6TV36_CHLSO|nr:hypothetical protein C2E21_3316 [Chlorella sorokiniana]|eukprot:PRW57935.1 hypothetical protein C2E21_3316 [Chlorella sorokiniana]
MARASLLLLLLAALPYALAASVRHVHHGEDNTCKQRGWSQVPARAEDTAVVEAAWMAAQRAKTRLLKDSTCKLSKSSYAIDVHRACFKGTTRPTKAGSSYLLQLSAVVHYTCGTKRTPKALHLQATVEVSISGSKYANGYELKSLAQLK